MAEIEPEFTERSDKLVGLGVDLVNSPSRWLSDIEETQGAKVDYPTFADSDPKVSKLWNTQPAAAAEALDPRRPRGNANRLEKADAL